MKRIDTNVSTPNYLTFIYHLLILQLHILNKIRQTRINKIRFSPTLRGGPLSLQNRRRGAVPHRRVSDWRGEAEIVLLQFALDANDNDADDEADQQHHHHRQEREDDGPRPEEGRCLVDRDFRNFLRWRRAERLVVTQRGQGQGRQVVRGFAASFCRTVRGLELVLQDVLDGFDDLV